MSDILPILLALLFIAVVFIVSMNKGMVQLLASGCAAAGGMVVFVLLIYLLPAIGSAAIEEGLNWKISLGASIGAAILVMVVLRLILGFLFRKLFGGDSQLNWMTDGLAGGVISLFPAFVGVVFLFIGFRVAGTVMELNYTASLSREGVVEMAGKIPAYPQTARWRNRIDSIPVVPVVLDLVDPFSNRSNRNAAAMVVVSRTGSLKSYMKTRPDAAELVASPAFALAAADPGVATALQAQDRAGLVLSPRVRQVAADPELNGLLRNLNLQRSLEGFVESLGPGE